MVIRQEQYVGFFLLVVRLLKGFARKQILVSLEAEFLADQHIKSSKIRFGEKLLALFAFLS